MSRRLRFELRYLFGRPPWDTGVTPPELEVYLNGARAGRAVEFGCGTGTNAIAMARRGWQVTAFDFSARALAAARRKARRAGVTVDFQRRDVTRLDDLAGGFDFGLDLGCFHGLDPARRPGYAQTVARLLRPGATLLLYTFVAPELGWPSEAELRRAFGDGFEPVRVERGEYHGRPSAWFTWERTA